MQRAKVF